MRLRQLPVLLVLAGCAGIPDTQQQQIYMSEQQFGPDYTVGVTSYYENTSVQALGPTYQPDMSVYVREQIRTSTEDAVIIDDWWLGGAIYNSEDTVSAIEQNFADELVRKTRVQVTFIPRAEIQRRLDEQFMESSAVLHSKDIAREQALDAFLVISFRPTLSRQDETAPAILAMATTVVMRSMVPDNLLYFKKGYYVCGDPIELTEDKSSFLALHECEVKIHQSIMADFFAQASAAGKIR